MKLHLPVLLAIVMTAGGVVSLRAVPATADPLAELRALTAAPTTYPANSYGDAEGVPALFFDNVPWRGRPTRVFARMALPASARGPVPGIVLVHGGGGSAFAEWVRRWNARGFAAISIAVEGQTDERDPTGPRGAQWKRHPSGGPSRAGIYGDSSAPLRDQWIYHAVAATIRANSLLRADPRIDAAKIGLMGISWGGVITSTVIGLDPRFAFAIPTYGCGDLTRAENQYGRALGDNLGYSDIWNPRLRMAEVTMPVLWLSWPADEHFPLDAQARCYRAAPGPRMVVLRPGMTHSHPAAWNPPDSYAFAESVVQGGRPWLSQSSVMNEDGAVRAIFTCDRPLDGATLVWTADRGFTGKRHWVESPANLQRQENSAGQWSVSAELPANATAWFVNVRAGELLGSSDFQER